MTIREIDVYFDKLMMICPWMKDGSDDIHIHTYGPPPKHCPYITEQTISEQPCT